MNTPTNQKLVNQWKKLNYTIGYGPSKEEDIIAIEKKYNVELPKDFRTYLLQICPNPHDGKMDDNYVTWWSLDNIKNIPDEYGREVENLEVEKASNQYLFFADHCIWSWAWAICCEPGKNYGRIIWIGDGGFFANSFTEFVDLYVARSPDFVGVPD